MNSASQMIREGLILIDSGYHVFVTSSVKSAPEKSSVLGYGSEPEIIKCKDRLEEMVLRRTLTSDKVPPPILGVHLRNVAYLIPNHSEILVQDLRKVGHELKRQWDINLVIRVLLFLLNRVAPVPLSSTFLEQEVISHLGLGKNNESR